MLCIPWMLFAKPLLLYFRQKQRLTPQSDLSQYLQQVEESTVSIDISSDEGTSDEEDVVNEMTMSIQGNTGTLNTEVQYCMLKIKKSKLYYKSELKVGK